jgi:quercetin dioxygenase-like cupin family protein
MEVVRTRPSSRRGPPEWFSGEAWIDVIGAGQPPSRVRAYSVHFAPGARTTWHRHPQLTDAEYRAQPVSA